MTGLPSGHIWERGVFCPTKKTPSPRRWTCQEVNSWRNPGELACIACVVVSEQEGKSTEGQLRVLENNWPPSYMASELSKEGSIAMWNEVKVRKTNFRLEFINSLKSDKRFKAKGKWAEIQRTNKRGGEWVTSNKSFEDREKCVLVSLK